MDFNNMGIANVCWTIRDNMANRNDARVLWSDGTIHAAAKWLSDCQFDEHCREFERRSISDALGEYKAWAKKNPDTMTPLKALAHGNYLRYARVLAGMSVVELAVRCPYSVSDIERLERGAGDPFRGSKWSWLAFENAGLRRPTSEEVGFDMYGKPLPDEAEPAAACPADNGIAKDNRPAKDNAEPRFNMLQGLLLRHARRVAGIGRRELADMLGTSVLAVNLLETGSAAEVGRWDGGWDDVWHAVGKFGIERPVRRMKPVTFTRNFPEDAEALAILRMHGIDLRWARSKAGIMQEELADLLGLTAETVKKLEDGLGDPPFGWDAMWSLMEHFEMPRPESKLQL